MYEFILAIHNIIRWVALVLLIVTTVSAFIGWLGKREWAERDRKFGVFTTIALDTQLLLGLIREGKGLTSRIFARSHLSLEGIRKEIEGRTVFREKVSRTGKGETMLLLIKRQEGSLYIALPKK